MNLTETAALLAIVAAYDRRHLGEADVIAWHGAIGDLSFDSCRDAAVKHYSSETVWLMPGHVRKLVNSNRTGDGPLALPEHDSGLKPMPSWFRSQIDQMWRRP